MDHTSVTGGSDEGNKIPVPLSHSLMGGQTMECKPHDGGIRSACQ